MTDEKKPFKKLTWKLAVIAKCRQCAITSAEVKRCNITTCALWPFRLGKSPKPDVNALDLLVFNDNPESVIFRIRKGKDDEEDDVIVTRKEYSAYIEDDDEEDVEDE